MARSPIAVMTAAVNGDSRGKRTDAIDLLAERLTTPLQIAHYLTLAFEEAFHIGQKPVTAEFVNRVLAISLNDPEPHLIRHGYNVKSLAQLINIRPAEIRAFFSDDKHGRTLLDWPDDVVAL